ncbi:hypothetical protein AKJ09_05045 [Labilithrix luteola]|uniref:ABM domain-containing protein n=1 Tax=Labilithrix luteola TaxID=1391654 RepID=A0A0K1PYC2_9BACT|nr:Atu4866 domain-containing protein [Labilithrix luteola]AKU98381.1 hypothetical protein AKJ09_05045 [Labilithrix luteola]
MSSTLTKTAFFTAKPGGEDALGARLLALVEPTRTEPGCVRYGILRSADQPDLWFVYEDWRDEAAFDAHMQTPYVQQFMKDVPTLCSKDVDTRTFHLQSKPSIDVTEAHLHPASGGLAAERPHLDARESTTTTRREMLDMEALEALTSSSGAPSRPILLTGGAVVAVDPMLGDWERADVLIVGSVIVGVGPGLLTAAADDKSIVIDCEGMVVLPAATDFTSPQRSGSLTPGKRADIVVVRIADAKDTPTGAVANRGQHVDILIQDGKVTLWRGRPLADSELSAKPPAVAAGKAADASAFVGMWIDENDFVRQELLSNGRYDEARGDRASAYQGQYWIHGNRIDYLDDLGFWAFGEFKDGVLYHAGYRFRRAPFPSLPKVKAESAA